VCAIKASDLKDGDYVQFSHGTMHDTPTRFLKVSDVTTVVDGNNNIDWINFAIFGGETNAFRHCVTSTAVLLVLR
jgi:hypothetical protein